ncbi:hypothetical protein O6H91_07G107800 [Diphasiastrum complanatum]|uniref:Uncharacterized protein n=8 Tax=Diphasiastrum complanatum TaxID=34168 RepID=A0ACC2D8C5_DIPCM|nr:hypothetical protein O6H91_07G098500 [Diphasiastrum complanatum]KAJ7550388.1 hypothetical protein O6H91_07G098500 [Diphasiastrum complanatum]KAJ7550389.1 hypothetical protein O6H91_07G098500 [Diphasiastrum complanatum]KAJ7550390.1 hypothetical protein O6H91_07G098500 [Diphasiastrum complanatum]KAJ7550586.1 hypothetical protein O6H91_07G107800 [Diphasiastrum complanatum]
MLGIFHKSLAHAPEELSAPGGASPDCRKKGVEILRFFSHNNPQAISVQFDEDSAVAYTSKRQALLRPRTFAVVDDIFCVFVGVLDNLPSLRQQYGLSKNVDEVKQVIEIYRALRDRAPYPVDQVMGDLSGQFAFVLFDNHTRTILAAADCQGKVPFFWGITSDGSLCFSDDAQLLKAGCGKSFAPFPAGCFFSSKGGLSSFEHPLNEVKAVPRVDSQGHMCGSTFKVDRAAPKHSASFPRVGSDATWPSAF